MENRCPSRDEITEVLRDGLLAGADFSDESTDTVKIGYRQTESEPWQPYTLQGREIFPVKEALTILVSLYEAGNALKAEMTATLVGDWDAEIDAEQAASS